MEQLLTTIEAARFLGCYPHTIANWRKVGKGPAFIKQQLGARFTFMYKMEDLEAFKADGGFVTLKERHRNASNR
jgi:hypothetical protein